MKMRLIYEFSRALQVLTGLSDKKAVDLGKKIDRQAPKEIITDSEVHGFVRDAKKGSDRYSAEERAVAPTLDFFRKALATKPEKAVPVPVEDMSKFVYPQAVALSKIHGELSLGGRQVIRGSAVGAILDWENPSRKLHDFAKRIASTPDFLTLRDVLNRIKDDSHSFDDYKVCRELLERYFFGPEMRFGRCKQEQIYKTENMEVFTNVDREIDVVSAAKVEVKLRPNIEVKAKPGDMVLIQSSLRHSEPELTRMTEQRQSVQYHWWNESKTGSTTTVLILRPGEAGKPPSIVDSVRLQIPPNVGHAKADRPPKSQVSRATEA